MTGCCIRSQGVRAGRAGTGSPAYGGRSRGTGAWGTPPAGRPPPQTPAGAFHYQTWRSDTAQESRGRSPFYVSMVRSWDVPPRRNCCIPYVPRIRVWSDEWSHVALFACGYQLEKERARIIQTWSSECPGRSCNTSEENPPIRADDGRGAEERMNSGGHMMLLGQRSVFLKEKKKRSFFS